VEGLGPEAFSPADGATSDMIAAHVFDARLIRSRSLLRTFSTRAGSAVVVRRSAWIRDDEAIDETPALPAPIVEAVEHLIQATVSSSVGVELGMG